MSGYVCSDKCWFGAFCRFYSHVAVCRSYVALPDIYIISMFHSHSERDGECG